MSLYARCVLKCVCIYIYIYIYIYIKTNYIVLFFYICRLQFCRQCHSFSSAKCLLCENLNILYKFHIWVVIAFPIVPHGILFAVTLDVRKLLCSGKLRRVISKYILSPPSRRKSQFPSRRQLSRKQNSITFREGRTLHPQYYFRVRDQF